LELVTREMEWTVNCFEYHESVWKKRAEEAESEGKMAYGWKQKSNWGRWAQSARNTFETVKGN
jgi:hypothetical protein